MAKWYGEIGFGEQKQTSPGIWVDTITTRKYCGDIIRNVSRSQPADKLNNDITIANRISIIADPFANMNVPNIRYVEFMGSKWKVSEVEANYPRLILTIGGVYNEPKTCTSPDSL